MQRQRATGGEDLLTHRNIGIDLALTVGGGVPICAGDKHYRGCRLSRCIYDEDCADVGITRIAMGLK